jgi:predicted nuclease of restriction endonuclease-like RecB superfamily
MLTVDMVQLRKDGVGAVAVVPRHGLSLPEAATLLQLLCDVIGDARSMGEVKRLLASSAEHALLVGQRKGAVLAAARLLQDAVDHQDTEAPPTDPAQVREALWDAAVAVRNGTAAFDRAAIVAGVASSLSMTTADVDTAIDASRKDSATVNVGALDPQVLAEGWEMAEVQALLWRAHRLHLRLPDAPAALRRLLRATRLQQLVVHFVWGHANDDTITIEGVLLSEGKTSRYGRHFAALLPSCWHWPQLRLSAELYLPRRGNTLLRYATFRTAAMVPSDENDGDFAIELHAALVVATRRAPETITVDGGATLLRGPQGAACVPDLVIHGLGRPIAVEKLGPWSRDSVFARLSLSQVLGVDLFLCVPQRLRVAESVADDVPAGVWVHRGEVRAKSLAEAIAAWIPHRMNVR